MPLEISSVSDDDIRKFVPDLFEAMGGDNNFVNATYPENLTEEGQKTAAERFIEHGKMDPTVRWCKVVDTDLGEIIGVSQWSVVQLHKPPEVDMDGPPGTWASDKDKEYARALNRSFMAYRREVFRKNELPIMSKYTPGTGGLVTDLDDPSCQHHGCFPEASVPWRWNDDDCLGYTSSG